MYYIKYRGYGLGQIIYLFISLFFTKICFPFAKLIRLPFFFRVSGHLTLGKGFTAGRSLRIDVFSNGNLTIGKNVQINDNCQISCAKNISVGNNVLIASKVFITDHDHDFRDSGNPIEWTLNSSNVIIEDGCWIGNGVHILKGVRLAKGCIVGAGSVVTKSFDAYSIIAGVPAKLISCRYSPTKKSSGQN
jgi:lipopolysaccharide O-acetyltransferase